MASQPTIHAHHYQHFENLQLSSNDFYTILETMIKEYQYPDVICKRATLKERGIFSSSREYLKISRSLYNFYVCAAPFGKSFFISWWLKEDANTTANVAEKVPWFGKIFAEQIESKSYYQLDSELMFTNSIHSIIKLAVGKVLKEYGLRTDATPATT
ncbi:MAG TPA: hypothetical protein VK668_20220 [Mucilaginibacter sp.]|nr:hypothetical protein [Mucilaginibacter sp.]